MCDAALLIVQGLLALATFVLEEGKGDVNTLNVFGETPLSIAGAEGHVALVELLLSHGADARRTGGTDCAPKPLLAATLAGQRQVVQLLLDRGGVDVDDRSSNGCVRKPGPSAS